jgi:hypothetical protein
MGRDEFSQRVELEHLTRAALSALISLRSTTGRTSVGAGNTLQGAQLLQGLRLAGEPETDNGRRCQWRFCISTDCNQEV